MASGLLLYFDIFSPYRSDKINSLIYGIDCASSPVLRTGTLSKGEVAEVYRYHQRIKFRPHIVATLVCKPSCREA